MLFVKKPILLSAVGGDGRQFYITDILSDFFDIETFGISGDRKCTCKSLSEAIDGAGILLLPLPVTRDGVSVNSSEDIPFCEMISSLDKKCKVCAGRLPPMFKSFLEEKEIEYYDFYEDEAVVWRNADITAEGAVSMLMNELDRSASGAEVLVSGYGRIGKRLAALLTDLGACVTVAARKKDSLFEAENTLRCSTDRINYMRRGILDTAERYDAIINTVPCRIFGEQNKDILKNAIYIELASPPHGGEPELMKTLCEKYVSAPSVPGTYAPRSAAEVIAASILGHYVYEGGMTAP